MLFNMIQRKPKPIMLEDVQRLVIKDGDIVVLKHARMLTDEACNRLKQIVDSQLKPIYPNIKVLVLEEGMDIGVLTKDAL